MNGAAATVTDAELGMELVEQPTAEQLEIIRKIREGIARRERFEATRFGCSAYRIMSRPSWR